MNKQGIKSELDELSDTVLNDLSPDHRHQLLLEAQVQEKEVWSDRLIETCPKESYYGPDYAVIVRHRLSEFLAYQAVYELHTTYLQYKLALMKHHSWWGLEYQCGEKLSDEQLEWAVKCVDYLRDLYATLHSLHHAFRRFATEVLGVDPETWLAYHSRGPVVFEAVTEEINDQPELKFAGFLLSVMGDRESEMDKPNQREGSDQQVALEDLVDQQYEALVITWEETTAKTS